jgi:hypothetical protein
MQQSIAHHCNKASRTIATKHRAPLQQSIAHHATKHRAPLQQSIAHHATKAAVAAASRRATNCYGLPRLRRVLRSTSYSLAD